MTLYIAREASKLWKRILAETAVEIKLLLDKWKLILLGLICQVRARAFGCWLIVIFFKLKWSWINCFHWFFPFKFLEYWWWLSTFKLYCAQTWFYLLYQTRVYFLVQWISQFYLLWGTICSTHLNKTFLQKDVFFSFILLPAFSHQNDFNKIWLKCLMWSLIAGTVLGN